MSKLIFTILVLITLKLQSQCFSGGFNSNEYKTYTHLLDLELDKKIKNEIQHIKEIFNVNANFFYINDNSSPNAFGGCRNNQFGTIGHVYFGLSLLNQELFDFNKSEIAITGILAHEFAHVYQCINESKFTGRERELQADMMAGYYLGKTGRIYDLKKMARSLFDKGDWFDPSHHGTPNERVQALIAGATSFRSNLSSFYNRTFEVVENELSEGINELELDLSDKPLRSYPSTIFGKWYHVKSIIDGKNEIYDGHEDCGKDYLNFSNDGSLEEIDIIDCEEYIVYSGKYYIENSLITMIVDGEIIEFKYLHSNGTLWLESKVDYNEDGNINDISIILSRD